MSREPRRIVPRAAYHLISRFVDRDWFIKKDDERQHYLELLGRSFREADWRLVSYAVMSNHIHLGVVAGWTRLDRLIRPVHTAFADAMNRAYDRIGCMFVRGPKAYIVADCDVANLIAYHHNNPVRAGLVERASQSSWTSHRAYLRESGRPDWLDVATGRQYLGLTGADEIDAWIANPVRRESEWRFTEEAHERELEMLREEARRAAAASKPSAAAVVERTAAVVGMSPQRWCSRSRREDEVAARTVAVHCSLRLGLSGPEIAAALHISQQGVSKITRRAPSPVVAAMIERATELLVADHDDRASCTSGD